MYIRLFYHLLLLELTISLLDLNDKYIRVSIYKTTQIDSNDLKLSPMVKILVDIERAASYMHFKMKKVSFFPSFFPYLENALNKRKRNITLLVELTQMWLYIRCHQFVRNTHLSVNAQILLTSICQYRRI